MSKEYPNELFVVKHNDEADWCDPDYYAMPNLLEHSVADEDTEVAVYKLHRVVTLHNRTEIVEEQEPV
jgi:hypothetical protein